MLAKKILSVILSLLLILPVLSVEISAESGKYDAKSVILIEASTGKVLYEENADIALPPASVTKVMTLLIVMEALHDGKISFTDTVTVSENAASMGGSQVYLEVGEQMSVDEMIKCVVVSSANDAAVALAEYVAGSEEMFVEKMNTRAKELGMVNTHFENTNGLDDTITNAPDGSGGKHLTSARDIAIMSRELIKHPKILEYSSIWIDTIRDGAFTLTNTNRLIRFYNGANGLKTGSTSKAGFCISATALRDSMQLIAVVMGSPNRDTRNEIAKKLLDFGFANYSVAKFDACELEPIKVLGGINSTCKIGYGEFSTIVSKGEAGSIEKKITIPDNLTAPIHEGEVIGNVEYFIGEKSIGTVDITALENADKIGYFGILSEIFKKALFC